MKRITTLFKRHKFKIALVVLLVVVGGWWYRSGQAIKNTKKIKSYTVKQEVLRDTLSISGEIDAAKKANLRFQTSGYLAWVGIKEGDRVKKFQVLANLDQRQVKKQLQQYLNTYSKSRWDFEQTAEDNKDYQTALMTEEARREIKRTVEKSQFDLNNAVLNVEIQDLSLKFSSLWTPIDGVVTKIDVPNAGVNITPASAEIQVVDPQSVYFAATADQSEVTKLVEGQKGEVLLDSFPDVKLEGTVESIGFAPRSGESSVVYDVKIKIDNSGDEMRYRLGMTGDISFVMSEKPVNVAVPSLYVKTENGRKYVIKKVAEKMVKTTVETGDTVEGLVEIKSGLKPGDIVYDQIR